MNKINKSNNKNFTDHILQVDPSAATDTLNNVLKELCLSTEPAGRGQKHIKSGSHTLFTGKSSETWEWLVKMGKIEYSQPPKNYLKPCAI